MSTEKINYEKLLAAIPVSAEIQLQILEEDPPISETKNIMSKRIETLSYKNARKRPVCHTKST